MRKNFLLLMALTFGIGSAQALTTVADTTVIVNDSNGIKNYSMHFQITYDTNDTVMTLRIDADTSNLEFHAWDEVNIVPIVPWAWNDPEPQPWGKPTHPVNIATNGGQYVKHVVLGPSFSSMMDSFDNGGDFSLTFLQSITFLGNIQKLHLTAYGVEDPEFTEYPVEKRYIKQVVFADSSMTAAPVVIGEEGLPTTQRWPGFLTSSAVAVQVPYTPNSMLLNAFRNDSIFGQSGSINDGSIFFSDVDSTSAIIHFYPVNGAGGYIVRLYENTDSIAKDSLTLYAANEDGTGISLQQSVQQSVLVRQLPNAIMGSMLTITTGQQGGTVGTDPINVNAASLVPTTSEVGGVSHYSVAVEVFNRNPEAKIMGRLGGELKTTQDPEPIPFVPPIVTSTIITHADPVLDNLYYDLMGRVYTQPVGRGVWIHNGTKLVIL